MKNPFTPEEVKLIIERIDNPYYVGGYHLTKSKEELKELLNGKEFKISDYEDLVWAICYMASNPNYIQELQNIHTNHDTKLVRLQQQAGIFVKRIGDSDKTKNIIEFDNKRTQKGNMDAYLDAPFLDRVYRKYVLNHNISIWTSIRSQELKKCRYGRMVSQLDSVNVSNSSQEGDGSIPSVGVNI